MKKFFTLIFTIFFIIFLTVSAENSSYYELSNNEKCLAAAKTAISLTDISSIAVIKKGRSVLCGIITEKGFLSSSDILYIKEILLSSFPRTKIRIEGDNALARDIIELSYYSSGKLKQHILTSRFNYLISKK